MEKGGFVYIMASGRNGTLYIGVTSDLIGRVWQHREGVIAGFTKRYDCKLLVWYEQYGDIELAIQREKQMKEQERIVGYLRERYESIVVDDKGEVFNNDLTQALELGFLLELDEDRIY